MPIPCISLTPNSPKLAVALKVSRLTLCTYTREVTKRGVLAEFTECAFSSALFGAVVERPRFEPPKYPPTAQGHPIPLRGEDTSLLLIPMSALNLYTFSLPFHFLSKRLVRNKYPICKRLVRTEYPVWDIYLSPFLLLSNYI